MPTVSDAIFNRLKTEVDTVFYLPGGGAMFLVDALGRSGLQAVCLPDERHAGIAAAGYAQPRGFGVCLVTTGPGVSNALTPCLACWLDSVPVLFISGQVRTAHIGYPRTRASGPQEGPTMALVTPITKCAYQPRQKHFAIPMLDSLIEMAKDRRPGPVWLDVPLDVQGAEL